MQTPLFLSSEEVEVRAVIRSLIAWDCSLYSKFINNSSYTSEKCEARKIMRAEEPHGSYYDFAGRNEVFGTLSADCSRTTIFYDCIENVFSYKPPGNPNYRNLHRKNR